MPTENSVAKPKPFTNRWGALDLIVPVHNEEKSIAESLRELSEAMAKRVGDQYRLLICEDGSTDKTLAIVKQLSSELPLLIITSRTRKGYARAVADGLRASTAGLCAVVEGDGQTDPDSLGLLLERIEANDLCVGWRNPRSDNFLRRFLSRAYRSVYRMVVGVPLLDPSYACILVRREALLRIMDHFTFRLPDGFFWEFNAWACALSLRTVEVPVLHRARRDGRTRVFRFRRLPAISLRNIVGLIRLRRDLRQTSGAPLVASFPDPSQAEG